MICRISRFDSVWHFEENDELTGSKIKSNCSNKCTFSRFCNGCYGWSCTRTGNFCSAARWYKFEPLPNGTFEVFLICYIICNNVWSARLGFSELYLGRKISSSITDNVCVYYNTFGHCAFIFVDDCNMCSAKYWSSNSNKKMVKFPAP